MNKLFFALALIAIPLTAFAQVDVGSPDASAMGITTSQQKLQLMTIERFENAGFWQAYISSDEGIAHSKLFRGTHPPVTVGDDPMDERYSDQNAPQLPNENILGVKIEFFKRGFNEIKVIPARPLPIEGITKVISVWVVGRNYNHELKVMVRDFFNNDFELSFGKLNFQGWRRMKVAVPPQAPDGKNGIIQRDLHYPKAMGLRITGFHIYCDPLDAYGTYYVYFDDLKAETDLFNEDYQGEFDPLDNW
jgi:hypothetical protein